MTFKDKKILIISPEPWDHIFVSKHNYAINLGIIGANVVFANPPAERWNVTQTAYENVRLLEYKKFLPGLRFLPAIVSKMIFKYKLKKIEQFLGIQFDVIWSFDNSVFFDFSALKPFCISHIVDLNQNFEFGKAAASADLCLYTSDAIGLKMQRYNSNAHFVNHGYHSERKTEPLKIPAFDGIKIGYAGNLNIPYLDWVTLESAFETLEDVQFYLAGPVPKSRDLAPCQNVVLLGKISSEEMASFYQQMDILIICYLDTKYPEQLSNPHKMMEYLASGKPIVCSHTQQYAEVKEINMASTPNTWLLKLQETIDHLDHWNQDDYVKKRKLLAAENTYQKQIERISLLVDQSSPSNINPKK